MVDGEDKRKQRNIRLYDSTFDRLVIYAGERHAGNISDAVEALLLRGMGEVEAHKKLDAQERQAELGEPVLAMVLRNVLAAELDERLPHTQLDRIEVNAGTAHLMVGDLMRCLYEPPPPCPDCGYRYPAAPTFAARQEDGALDAALRATQGGTVPRLPR